MSKNRNLALVVGGLALGGYAIYKLIKNADTEVKNEAPPHNPLDLPFPILADEGQEYDGRVLLMQQFLNNAIELNEDGLSPIDENGYYTNQFRNRLEYFMTDYIYDDYLDEQIIEIGYDPEITTGNGDFITEELLLLAYNTKFGCKDPEANNYNPSATNEDGSCTYTISGCTDEEAVNYNELATNDDGSCYYQPL